MTVGFALGGFAVLLAPALAMRWGVAQAGVGNVDADILIASVVVGATHVLAVLGRIRRSLRTSARLTPVWIASLNALVVLALGASLLLLGVLFLLLPDEHVSLASHGSPVVVLWGGAQMLAVVLAEVTAHLALRRLRAA